tara:strand:+ start:3641 stop:4009 length:369 start_codon:yes stop_codon:yes gene_type:complete
MQPLELLSRILDDTYNPVSKSGTYSLKHSLQGNVLVVKFMTVMHLAAERSFDPQVDAAKDHARQLIKGKLDRLKKDYKDQTGESLKITDKGEQDSVELIQSTSNSPRKVAYYRLNQTVTLDV